jgi:hypothetical protein
MASQKRNKAILLCLVHERQSKGKNPIQALQQKEVQG